VAERWTQTSRLEHNYLHGLLVQLHSLLQFHHSNVANAALPATARAALGSVLLPALLSSTGRGCAWLGEPSLMRAAPVRLLYLQVLELAIECVEASAVSGATSGVPSIDAARRHQLWLCARACDPSPAVAAPNSDSEAAFEGVGVDGLREEAAAMLVRCITAAPQSALPDRTDLTALLLTMVRDSISSTGSPSLALLESLLSALKRCLVLHPSVLLERLDWSALASHLLEEHLARFVNDFATSPHTNQTIVALAFQLLLELTQRQPYPMVQLCLHFDVIQQYAARAADVPAKAAAMHCLARSLFEDVEALRSMAAVAEEASAAAKGTQAHLRRVLSRGAAFLSLLERYVDDEQPVVLRHACVRAVQYGGLLAPFAQHCKLALPDSEPAVAMRPAAPVDSAGMTSMSPLYSVAASFRSLRGLVVRLWVGPLLLLLQDENESVRTDCSTLVGGVVDERAADVVEFSGEEEQRGPSVHDGTAIVSRVLEETFVYLGARFGDEPLLADSLELIMRFYAATQQERQLGQAGDDGTPAVALPPSPSPSPSPSSPSVDAAMLPSSSAATASSTARVKLFEHEKCNTVIEELVLLELAASCLAALTRRTNDATQTDTVVASLEWWNNGLQAALRFVSSSDTGASGAGWLGGESFKEIRFAQLYGHLLGVSAALRWLQRQTPAALGSERVGAIRTQLAQQLPQQSAMGASAMHPLLQRALASVAAFTPIDFLAHRGVH
jgi:hypothetical protein